MSEGEREIAAEIGRRWKIEMLRKVTKLKTDGSRFKEFHHFGHTRT